MPSLADLLGRGYFPKELPPPFSSSSLVSVLLPPPTPVATTGAPGAPPVGAPTVPPAVVPAATLVAGFPVGGTPSDSAQCVHNLVRQGGLRRNLAIPNPVHYVRLAEWVANNWPQLKDAASTSPFSLTKPVDSTQGRAIDPHCGFVERIKRRAELRATSRTVLRLDVNRFYPSIYTHSIPWAIHGKAAVKAAMAAGTFNNNPMFWSSRLDTLLRNTNSKQTVGIPIGPDISLLVAEILLAAVDAEVSVDFPTLKGVRFVDDYEFGLQSQSQGDQVLSKVQAVLSKYDLAINAAKTRYTQLPEPLEAMWASRLRLFRFPSAGAVGQRNEMIAYFGEVFEHQKEERDEGILKYAIARLNGIDIHLDNVPLYQQLLSQCARSDPSCLPLICEQLTHYCGLTTLDLDLWKETLNVIVQQHLPLGHASESAWAMWILRVLGQPIVDATASVVAGSDDSVAALMGLGLASVGLGDMALLSAGLNSRSERTELLGPQWLVCYEGAHQGWLSPPSGTPTFGGTPQLDFLHANGVSFFNINVTPPPPRRNQPPTYGAVGGGYDD